MHRINRDRFLKLMDEQAAFGATEAGGDNTANDLLTALQPDIYFKGGDYKVEEIPEAEAVQAYGGEIAVMPAYDGHSTTESIEKIKAQAAE